MKVEVKVSAETNEPYAVIYTNAMTPEVQKLLSMIDAQENVITANDNERTVILRPEEIYMVRMEAAELIIYCQTKKYISNKRLYEVGAQLGQDFMQISKSTFINLKKMDCVEPSFNGMMVLNLKNGCKEYISRKYLPNFKKYLGI